MADATVTAANVRPLDGAVVKDFSAGEALTVGDVVYIASDGDVQKSDANAAVSSLAVGIVVASYDGETSIASGDPASVVLFGPVSGFSSLTDGSLYYVSETAGKLAIPVPSGAGTWTHAMGYALRDGVFFVQPGVLTPVSNS